MECNIWRRENTIDDFKRNYYCFEHSMTFIHDEKGNLIESGLSYAFIGEKPPKKYGWEIFCKHEL